jgi:alpha-D-ribose 1-methylphosphonate 5-triphosphate synthase subunit PhnH
VWTDIDRAFNQAIVDAQNAFRVAICDSFDYPECMKLIDGLVTGGNNYLNGTKVERESVCI